MKEIWKDIENYKGIYQCSNFGHIRSLDRNIKRKNGIYQHIKGQTIKPQKNINGYLQVGLNKNSKRQMLYVHILVAKTFVNNPNKYKTVNHKDGNKQNNNADNLEWMSYSDNNKHSYKYLHRKKSLTGAKCKSVYFIDILNGTTVLYKSINETSRNVGLSPTQINRYINSKNKWKGKYIFLSNSNKCVEDIEKVS